MKNWIILVAFCAIGSFAATLDGNGYYTGKVVSIGCDANSQNCKLQLELPFNNGPAGCSGKTEIMWYGRTPSGAVMTSQMTKAALVGKTFGIQLSTTACFLGNAGYPTMTFYNITP